MSAEYVYDGHDNAISKILKEDGIAVDLSSTTRITLQFGTTVLDTEDAGTTLDTGGNFDVSEGSGKLIMRLGDQGITAGNYNAELVIYDSTHDDGIVWGDIKIIVE